MDVVCEDSVVFEVSLPVVLFWVVELPPLVAEVTVVLRPEVSEVPVAVPVVWLWVFVDVKVSGCPVVLEEAAVLNVAELLWVLVEADPVVSVFVVSVVPVFVESVLDPVVPDVVPVEVCWVVLEEPVCVEAVPVVVELPLVSVFVVDWLLVTAVCEPEVDIEDVVEPEGMVVVPEEAVPEVISVPVETVVVCERVVLQSGP